MHNDMMKTGRIILFFSLLALALGAGAVNLPSGWTADGKRFGDDGMEDIYSGDLQCYYAKTVSVDGRVLSDAFIIDKPCINLKFKDKKFEGILSLITVDDDGNHREMRRIPPFSQQGKGWLNSGWFAFDVKDIPG